MNAHHERPKVLVIDDDHDFLCDLKAWLTREGFRTHGVEVGKAGIQHFRLYRPYVAVVLDLHMPKVNGWDVLKQIKSADSSTKVAILTGDATAREQAFALGADAFVVKPIGRKHICKLVNRLTGNAN
jgi:CheY-like chemotaxis protein